MDTNIQPTLFEARIYQPLVSSFEKLTDLRFKRGIRYQLKPVLILLFLSKLGGADTPAEIADWVNFRFAFLKQLLGLDWQRSPHEVTWERILGKGLKACEVEMVFGQYLRQMSAEETRLLNLDGKVVCGVKLAETGQQLHLLALQDSAENLTVEQTALKKGENEISAAKRLLENAALENKIVSGDAIFAQTELAAKVVEKGGEYLWKLRANQGRMYQMAKEHFEQQADKYPGKARSLDKGHGRIDEREILTSFRIAAEIEFPHLEQVFRIKRKSEAVKTGKRSEQTIYGITSLAVEEFGAKELLDLTRKHWHIENGLHYRRDVTFKEDKVRKKSINSGQIMATLNNLAIGVLRKTGWENLAKARRFYNAQIEKALKLITNSPYATS
jgi:predicted transposase YbfD/YdcC